MTTLCVYATAVLMCQPSLIVLVLMLHLQRSEPNYEYEQDYHHAYEELPCDSSLCDDGSCFIDDNLVPTAYVTKAYVDAIEYELALLTDSCKVFTDINMVPQL
jgi:hypothetical protein